MALPGIGSTESRRRITAPDEQPCDQGAEKTAGVSDSDGVADHAEVQEGEDHLSRDGFDQAFECDECKRKESHSEKEFVVSMPHEIECGYGHEAMRDGGQAAQAPRGQHRVGSEADDETANGAADAEKNALRPWVLLHIAIEKEKGGAIEEEMPP